MNTVSDKPMLVAIWVMNFQAAEQAFFYNNGLCDRSARVSGTSLDNNLTIRLTTNALSQELLAKFERLHRFGFTVLELGEDWRDEYRRPRGWRDQLINEALAKVDVSDSDELTDDSIADFDSDLAQAVLAELNRVPTRPTTVMELKHSLNREPSDNVLLTVLETLKLDRLIEGFPESSQRKLNPKADIKITGEGRKHLGGSNTQTSVTHHYNNWGQAGAMGPNSVGTINYQQQWSQIENQTNLAAVADQFEQAIKNRASSAASSADFAELQLMAQAKEQAQKDEGSKLVETITAIGRTALPILTSAGAHGLVSLLEHKFGIKLS